MSPRQSIPGPVVPASQSPDYLSFLHTAAQEINSSTDYVKTLKNVANAMVPHLSDWCAVDILNDDDVIERVAIAHVNKSKIKIALELGTKYPRPRDANSGATHVLRTGEPMMVNNVTDAMLAATASNDEHLALMRALNFHSIMIFPIKSHRKILGTITFVWTENHKSYSLADLAFAETLCTIAGHAIDNARLAEPKK